jgi:hypothetical protein
MRCDSSSCDHCSTLPPPSAACLAIKQMPFGLFYSPTPSQQPNHFLSLLEMMRANQLRSQGFNPAYPDEHCPSQHTAPQPHKLNNKISKQPPERCSLPSCKNYGFSSFSDFVKHMRLVHPVEWAAECKAILVNKAAKAKKVAASAGKIPVHLVLIFFFLLRIPPFLLLILPSLLSNFFRQTRS